MNRNMNLLLFCLLCILYPYAVFAADTLGKTPVRTSAKTDVQVELVDQGGSTLANIQTTNTAPGAGGALQVLPVTVAASKPTLTDTRIATLYSNTSGEIYVSTSSGQLPASLGQTTMAASLSVAIASNQSTIPVSTGAPTGAAAANGTAANIAASGTTALTCKGSLTISQPVKVYQVVVTGAAYGRCTVRYNNNTSMTNFGDVVTSPSSPTSTFACQPGFCAVTAGGAGTQAIEANCTNFDSVAQDFQCSVQYCQAASGC